MAKLRRLYEWQLQKEKLVHSLEDCEIDLRPIKTFADVRMEIENLRLKPCATPRMVRQAYYSLEGYVRWMRAEKRLKRLRERGEAN